MEVKLHEEQLSIIGKRLGGVIIQIDPKEGSYINPLEE